MRERDWYDEGQDKLFEELEVEISVHASNHDKVQACYSFLVNIGLIDYDIEKEIIYERYFGDEE